MHLQQCPFVALFNHEISRLSLTSYCIRTCTCNFEVYEVGNMLFQMRLGFAVRSLGQCCPQNRYYLSSLGWIHQHSLLLLSALSVFSIWMVPKQLVLFKYTFRVLFSLTQIIQRSQILTQFWFQLLNLKTKSTIGFS